MVIHDCTSRQAAAGVEGLQFVTMSDDGHVSWNDNKIETCSEQRHLKYFKASSSRGEGPAARRDEQQADTSAGVPTR